MFLFCFVLALSLCHITLCVTAPIDTVIIQVQVSAQPLMQQVFLNGLAFTSLSQEIDNIVQSLADAILPIGVNQTAELRNHTVLRSRSCILEGSELHWTDRVFYDGEVHLSLEPSDTWTAHVPQALHLKTEWDQEVERTKVERVRLQEGCIQLMKELKFTQEEQVPHIPLPQVLIPILAVVVFTGIFVISLCLSKSVGLRHPGGVIGSVIHYSKDIPDETSKGFDYQTI